jgi:hypothetical protein
MNELSWGLWPPVPLVGEVYGAAHLDGVRLHRDAVVLMAIACGHVIGWHVVKSETAAARAHPIAGIAPPLAVAVDGGAVAFRRRCASTGLIPRRGGAGSACA